MNGEGVFFGMLIGAFFGWVFTHLFLSGGFDMGAIAATKGEYVCKQVPQFVGEPQWQCRSVYGE